LEIRLFEFVSNFDILISNLLINIAIINCMRKLSIMFFLFAIIFVAYAYSQRHANSTFNTSSPAPTAVLGEQTKTADCIVNGPFPDKECTPGAVFEGVTVKQICTPGYSASVRNVPISEKNQVYAEYGILTHSKGEYEVDHMISLELGGSNDISNLWPESANPNPGFHEKDEVENYLHDEVCSQNISLSDAQQEIATDWLSVYKRISNPHSYDWGNSGKN